MSERGFQNLAFVALAIVASVLFFLSLHFWQFGYNSDFAMIGLMAKRVLTTGEHPIFVWKVGYQGTLLEASAVAFFFKRFGISPVTLNLAPLFFCLLLLVAFFLGVKRSFGTSVALVATLVLTIASPNWYASVLRTQPNYSETYLFGAVLFLLYPGIVQSLLGRDDSAAAAVRFAWFGVIAGFAFYTYGQIIYFFEAMGIHAAFLYWRRWKISPPPKTLPALFFPGAFGARGPLAWVKRSLMALFVLGAINALLPIESFSVAGRIVHWSNVVGCMVAVVALVLLHVSNGLSRLDREGRRRWGRLGGVGFTAFLVGYSPKIYYNLVLHEHSQARLNVGGGYRDMGTRAGIALRGNLEFLHLTHIDPVRVVAGLALLAALFFFVAQQGKLSRSFLRGRLNEAAYLKDVSPYAWLWVAVLFSFLISKSVSDICSARYTLALFLFYAVAFGYGAVWVFRRYCAFWARATVVGASLLFLGNELHYHYEVYRDLPGKRYFLQDAIDFLKARGIQYAYGNYWYAYSTTFLTNEALIVEPFNSNYYPGYGARVAEAPRIAVLDAPPFEFARTGNQATIYGNRYRISETREFNGVTVFLLDKEM